MRYLSNTLLLVLTFLALYSCKRKAELPVYENFAGPARQDPEQTPTERPAFTVHIEDQTHTVTLLYDYTITGMVVSSGFSRTLAERRNDHLNILDVGIIWGGNLDPQIYRNVEFYNDGVWLHARTENESVWQKLNPQQLSNNHLLSNDPHLIKSIGAVKLGDVIKIRGSLATYSGRRSSVKRSDSGDGACETIWVDEFSILQEANKPWHRLHRTALYGIFSLLGIRILLFFLATPSGYRPRNGV
jgi:hypothetical protein